MENCTIDTTAAKPLGARFTIDRAVIAPIVAFMAKRIIERRNSIPILSNIAFTVDHGTVTLSATDLDIEARACLDCVTDSPGTFTLDGATLSDVLKKADGQLVTFRFDDGRVHLASGRLANSLPALPIDRMPAAPPISENAHRFTLSAEYARDLAALTPAISKDESRYYLQGVHVEVSDGRLFMVATDGNTMAVIDRPAPIGATGMPHSLIHRKAITALLAATGKVPGTLSVEIDARAVSFTLDGLTLTSKLIDGTFPDWRFALDAAIGENAPELVAIPFLNDRLALDGIAKLEKACGLPLSVETGDKAALLTNPAYPELFGLSLMGRAGVTAKGFSYQRDEGQEIRARDYLRGLADAAGLNWRKYDLDSNLAYCAHWATGESEPRMIGMTFGRIEQHRRYETIAREIVDYETFTTRTESEQVEIPAIWQDGAFSIAMPRAKAFDYRGATVSIQDDAGNWSSPQWVAQDSRGGIALSAEAVRQLAGPVDPSTFVNIPELVIHRGIVMSIDGVPTEAMPEGWTVATPLEGKALKAAKVRMAQLAKSCEPRAMRELETLAASLDVIRPLAAHETEAASAPIAEIEPAAPVSVESEADLSPVTPCQPESGTSHHDEPESLPAPQMRPKFTAIEPQPEISAESARELADWQAFMVARFGELEAKVAAISAATIQPDLTVAPSEAIAADTPISGKTRTAAHVRAIMAYLHHRKYRANAKAAFIRKSEEVEFASKKASKAQARTFEIMGEKQSHAAKRRRAIKRALRLRESRAFWQAKAGWWHEQWVADMESRDAEIARLKITPTYIDGDSVERRDHIAAASYRVNEITGKLAAETLRADTATAKLETMATRIEAMETAIMAATGRALRAETALAAVQARANGWKPAVAKVTFAVAA